MKKHTSEEALHERMRNLAGVNKPSLKESKNRTLGTLIDYKRAADGVAYGIIKEQHHYYIKKGGLNENLNVADFAYIGGLANITEFQYNKLSEAEKQRNMLFATINEAYASKVSKSGSKKKMLTEDKAGQEIEMAASKVNDLDAATDAAEPAMDAGAEMDAGLEAMDGGAEVAAGDAEVAAGDAEVAAGDAEMGAAGDELSGGDAEMGAGDAEEIAVSDPETETEREIEKSLGKITNQLRKTELTDSQVKSYVNTFLSAFKDKFPDIDIEDRKKMAEKITKVVPPEDIEDLGQNVEDTEIDTEITPTEPEEVAEEQCAECGGFAQYAESRGYTAESIQECGEEEMTNLVSGYANAHDEGQNDGDFKAIALFISPEIIEKLRSEYGHDEFANQVEPFSTEMNECGLEEKQAQINELFGGLRNLGRAAGQSIKQGVQNIGQGIQQKAQQVGQAVGQKAQQVKQTYHAGELSGEVKKVEKAAADLGAQIGFLNKRMQKAGGQPINIGSILTTIKNQVAGGAGVSLSKYSNVQEEGIPVDSTEVQPALEEDVEVKVSEKEGKKLSPQNIPVKEMKENEEKEGEDVDIDALDVSGDEGGEEVGFSAGFEPMGGGVVKPNGAETTTVEVTKDSVNVKLSESKEKPSTGLSKEKKSSVVKAAKKGEDIGKKGKGFEKVADKAAKEYGSKEKGEKVAAAAMWKNIKREGEEVDGEVMTESEKKLRMYIRKRLEEHAGIRKPNLNESVKSAGLKKLDRIIDKQFGLYESEAKKKVDKNLNEVFGFSIREKFAKLNPQDAVGVEKVFDATYHNILTNPRMGGIGRVAKTIPTETKYDLIRQYVEGNGGTLRLSPDGMSLRYAPETIKRKSLENPFASGGTGGKTQLGGV